MRAIFWMRLPSILPKKDTPSSSRSHEVVMREPGCYDQICPHNLTLQSGEIR